MYDTPPPFFCPLDFSRCVETGRSGVVIRCWVCAFAFAQWFFVFFLPIWTIFWDFVYRKLICDPLVCVQHLAWPPRGPFVSNGHLPTVWPAYSDPLFFPLLSLAFTSVDRKSAIAETLAWNCLPDEHWEEEGEVREGTGEEVGGVRSPREAHHAGAQRVPRRIGSVPRKRSRSSAGSWATLLFDERLYCRWTPDRAVAGPAVDLYGKFGSHPKGAMIDDMKRDIQHTASESGLPASTYNGGRYSAFAKRPV